VASTIINFQAQMFFQICLFLKTPKMNATHGRVRMIIWIIALAIICNLFCNLLCVVYSGNGLL
jgi:hypothetical protein